MIRLRSRLFGFRDEIYAKNIARPSKRNVKMYVCYLRVLVEKINVRWATAMTIDISCV